MEGIALNEISQTEKDKYYMILHVEPKTYNKLVNITKRNRLTDIKNKIAVTSREREEGRGNIGIQRHKISYKDTLYNTGNIANMS